MSLAEGERLAWRLFEAVETGDLAAVQAAVADGASVMQEFCGQEPLHLASMHGHLDIAQWLHSAGASLDATDNQGGTPLHTACSKGHLDIAQWLHSAGASLNATHTSDGYTPLHNACCQGRLEIAQWLCSAGADATLKTNGGETPAQLLQRRARTLQLDQQALRSTLACLVRRAQAQGLLPNTIAPPPRRWRST